MFGRGGSRPSARGANHVMGFGEEPIMGFMGKAPGQRVRRTLSSGADDSFLFQRLIS